MKSCYMFCHSKSNTRVVLCIPVNGANIRPEREAKREEKIRILTVMLCVAL